MDEVGKRWYADTSCSKIGGSIYFDKYFPRCGRGKTRRDGATSVPAEEEGSQVNNSNLRFDVELGVGVAGAFEPML
jgi:hypothetical protein